MVKIVEGVVFENRTVLGSRCFRSSPRRKCQAVVNQMKSLLYNVGTANYTNNELTNGRGWHFNTGLWIVERTSSRRSSGRFTRQFPSVHSSVMCPTFSSFGSSGSVSIWVKVSILLFTSLNVEHINTYKSQANV